MVTNPPAPTGFQAYQNQNGGAAGSSSSGGSFPTQSVQTPYPGLSQSQLNTVIPGATSAGTVMGQPYEPGGSLYGPPVGGGAPETLAQLLDDLLLRETTNPEIIPLLQDQLIMGGYLNPTSRSYVPGTVQPGDATWSAYRDLLLAAAGTKTPYQQLLDQNVQNQVGAKKFNLSTTTDTTQIANPQDARQALAKVMEDELGRKPLNREISAYIANLHAAEQRNPVHDFRHYDLSAALNAGNGGAMTGALGYGIRSLPRTDVQSGGVNPEIVAENQIMQNNGKELARTKATEVYQLFLNMLQGEGSVG